jgi:hypothetical protein
MDAYRYHVITENSAKTYMRTNLKEEAVNYADWLNLQKPWKLHQGDDPGTAHVWERDEHGGLTQL